MRFRVRPRLVENEGFQSACEILRRTFFWLLSQICDLLYVQLMSFSVKLLLLLQYFKDCWQLRRSMHYLFTISRLLAKVRLYSSNLLTNSCFSTCTCLWNSFSRTSISISTCILRLSNLLSSYYESRFPFYKLPFMESHQRLPIVRQYTSQIDLAWLLIIVVSHSTPSTKGLINDS